MRWITVAMAVLLLGGCVSQEKYEAAQARADEAAKLERELAELQTAYESMEKTLREEIRRQEATIEKLSHDTIAVTLEEPILFDSGAIDISVEGARLLRKVGKGLREAPHSLIRIVGHTDSFPITDPELKARFTDNWELSAARAAAVARVFIWSADVNPARIRVEGRADTDPVADNATAKGRQKNRRIAIFVTNGG